MPRNMSFFYTTPQIRARTKTVTRRLGWRFLKAGDHVMVVEKGQGLKKGEKVKRLGPVRIVSVRREPLGFIGKEGRAGREKEGFPGMTPADFIEMFCDHNGGDGAQTVTRIEFEYLD